MTTQSYEKKFYINVNITGLFYDTPDTESAESIAVGKFLAADVECIESVGAVGAMLALLLKCFVKEPLKFAKEFVKALFLS